MKPPILINTVLPAKIYHVYSAKWQLVTDIPAPNAAQALADARKIYGPVCTTAVITTAVIKDDYARTTHSPSPAGSPGIPRPERARSTTTRSAPARYAAFGTRPARGLAIIGATISPAGPRT